MGNSRVAKTEPRRLIAGTAPRLSAARIVHSPDPEKRGAVLDLSSPDAGHVLGRSCAFAVEDPRLSRQHCRIQRVGAAVRVEDLGSSNGTFLHGKEIGKEYVQPQMSIRMGDTLLVFDQETEPRLESGGSAPVPELVGESFAMQALRQSLRLAGPTGGSVLLRGASGTGKELAAHALHRLSMRRGSFIAVNCAAIAPELADAELFGHRRGAFTGADEARPGLFVEADGGTLFLDEVGDLLPGLQVKLLRALEERRIRPVGSSTSRPIDVRVIAATNVDLERSGFRADLRARLSHWVIRLPSLAARRSDILLLARNFVSRHAPAFSDTRWTAELAEALLLHDWPLNVRELENVIRRLVALDERRAEWDIDLLPEDLRLHVLDRRAEERSSSLTGPDRDELERALEAAKGNVAEVAALYQRDRTQIYRWLERLGLDAAMFREGRRRGEASGAVTNESVTVRHPHAVAARSRQS